MGKTVYIKTCGLTISWGGKHFRTPSKVVIEEQKLKVFCRLLDKDNIEYEVLDIVNETPTRKPIVNKRPQKGIGINLKFQG